MAGAALVAVAKNPNDSKNNTVISNSKIDTVNYLTAEETANLINNDTAIKDEIAAGIYYKDIGSRSGLTISESDIKYAAASDTVKRVYRNKAITDVRKLVANGTIKINRTTQEVSVSVEKATI